MQVVTLFGPMNTGKSTFLLTCPDPIFVFDLELGMGRADWRMKQIEKELDTKIEYTKWSFELSPDELLESVEFTRGGHIHGRIRQWDQMMTKFVEIIKAGKHKTIGFDTAKVLWDADNQSVLEMRQKENPNKQTLDPMEYGAPNLRMNNVIDICRRFDINLVLINHERDVYTKQLVSGQLRDAPSGEKELDGWRQTLDISDWILYTDCDVKLQSGQTIALSSTSSNSIPQGEFTFKTRIDKSPVGAGLKGRVVNGLTYNGLVRLEAMMKGQVNGNA